MNFTHLHVHTTYSLLDGSCKVKDLVKRTKDLGMTSLAISDHGVLFGVVEFYEECLKQGIKPIIGMEAYMAPGDRRDRSLPSNEGKSSFHLLLLAQNLQGYKNLAKLSTISYREGFYYKPRIDKDILAQFKDGLICTSACLGGELAQGFMRHRPQVSRETAEWYAKTFGPEKFFIEVQGNGVEEQAQVNPELQGLAKRLGVGTVMTNDVHFLNKDDHFAHDVLCCVSMAKDVNDQTRLKYPTELYLKSPQDMKLSAVSWGIDESALDNTNRIAAKCDVQLDLKTRHAPRFKVPKDDGLPGADAVYLRQQCEAGLKWRYPGGASKEIRDRLDYELKTIESKDFCSYFLIVWDVCNFCRENNIPIGARGSAVGTVAGYLLGLCNVDPLKYGLLFERFMDPSRNEMPDVDLDMCQEGRARVIEYVKQKYGHVSQIITFNTLGAKAAVRDVARVLRMDLMKADQIAKLIPAIPLGVTLQHCLDEVPDFKNLYDTDKEVSKVVDIAQKLEGLVRNAGVHAAGIVIADRPLEEFLPLYERNEVLCTQYEGSIVEKVGLLKMDFLGLRTLTVMQRAVDLVNERHHVEGRHGVRLDIEAIDYEDPAVLDLFRRGETKGVFQFESDGMRQLLMKMQPDRIEDLIAANALYRPGPMDLIPDYIARKHGDQQVPSVHPIWDEVLDETYGVMVYQEDIMKIFHRLGGIELSAAYKLIKAISKKQADVIESLGGQFLKGAQAQGLSEGQATEIFDNVKKFAKYGFNKSHATRYSVIAYQTAYLKVYHPLEFFLSLLTLEAHDTEKLTEYLYDARHALRADGIRGFAILPPDVNESGREFSCSRAGDAIRFGLGAVKGVGEGGMDLVIRERKAHGKYTSLADFCNRVPGKKMNRGQLESLIRCGAFDSLGIRRSQLLSIVTEAISGRAAAAQDRRTQQIALFAGKSLAPEKPLPDLPELSKADVLKAEKELLGFYVTGHPLDEFATMVKHYATHTITEALEQPHDTPVTVAGMVSNRRILLTRRGKDPGRQMAVIKIEDHVGETEAVVFPEAWDLARKEAVRGDFAVGHVVFIMGTVNRRREMPSIVADFVIPMGLATEKLTTAMVIKLTPDHGADAYEALKPVLEKHKGRTPTYLQVVVPGTNSSLVVRLDAEWSVFPNDSLHAMLQSITGPGSVQMCGLGTKAKRNRQAASLVGG